MGSATRPVVACKPVRCRLGHAVQPVLAEPGRAVIPLAHSAGSGAVHPDPRDSDQHSPELPFYHSGPQLVHHPDSALQVKVEVLVKSAGSGSSIVDEDIDLPEPAERLAGQLTRTVLHAQVGIDHLGLPAVPADRLDDRRIRCFVLLVDGLRAEVIDHDRCSSGSEQFRIGTSEPAARSGDEGNPSVVSHFTHIETPLLLMIDTGSVFSPSVI